MKQLEVLLKDFVNNHYDDYEITGAYSDMMNDYRPVEEVMYFNNYKVMPMRNILTEHDYYDGTRLNMFYRLEDRYSDVKFRDMKQVIVNDIIDITKFIDYLANQMYDMDMDEDIYKEYSYYIYILEDEVLYNLNQLYNNLTSSWLTW